MKRWMTLTAALLLTACGSSPKTQFYTLVSEPPAHASPAAPSGPPIQLGHVELPGTLDRTALVTEGPGAQVNVSGKDRWAAPLDELIQRALTDDLRARLGPDAVLEPGDPAPRDDTRHLLLVIQRFDAGRSGEVVLQADWSLSAQGKPATIHHVQLQDNAGGSVATAMSRTLARLADQITNTLI